jgi:hypothetical protein
MSETNRLGPWGWFVRAFAAGLGVMCGVLAAAFMACIFYGLVIGGIAVLSSIQVQQVPASAAQLAPASYQQCTPPSYANPAGENQGATYAASTSAYAPATPCPSSYSPDVQYFAAPAAHQEPCSESDEEQTR